LPEWVQVHFYQEIGWDLMDLLTTPARVILVDATCCGLVPGQVTVARIDALGPAGGASAGCHGLGLPALIELGAALCPDRQRLGVTLVGIEAERIDGFSMELSPSVCGALSEAARRVLWELGLVGLWTARAEAMTERVCEPKPTIQDAHGG
jgi:hydrogenase maturation protease